MNSGIEFFFAPFKELKSSANVPIMVYGFEGQSDSFLQQRFPEIAALRRLFDSAKKKEAIPDFQINLSLRNKKRELVVLLYIGYPWKKNKQWNLDDINFYREVYVRTWRCFGQVFRNLGCSEINIILPSQFHPKNIMSDHQQDLLLRFIRIVTEAIVCRNSEDVWKTDKRPPVRKVTFTYYGNFTPAVDVFFQKAISEGVAIGEATAYVRHLIKLPPNKKSPEQFVIEALGASASFSRTKQNTSSSVSWRNVSGHNFSPQVSASVIYGTDALRQSGFGLIAGVGQGSSSEPLLLKIDYRPKVSHGKKVKRLVLAGKGVVFDTGGIHIKSMDDCYRMHYDMAGAATVLGLVRLVDSYNIPVRISALLPMVHNAVGSSALIPESIVTAYDGKTVEITNTDAEGRLIIADVLAYAKRHLRADYTVSVATLFGVQAIAPDLVYVLATNKRLEQRIARAGVEGSEKIFFSPPLQYLNRVDSDYVGTDADLVNSVDGTESSGGAVFLSYFVSDRPLTTINWAHVDISALFEDDADIMGVGPGVSLRTLWNFVKGL